MTSQRAHFQIVVENLGAIAQAYSEGVAGRVLGEIWRRFEQALPSERWVQVHEAWGVSLRFAGDWFHEACVDEVDEAVHGAALLPLVVGKAWVVVSLALREGEGGEVMAPPPVRFDAGQYRSDMGAAVLAYSRLAAGDVSFAEQPVVSVSDRQELLYRERLVRLSDSLGRAVSPAAFLPALERLGLTRAFDRYVVNATLTRLEKTPDLVLGCNVSGLSLSRDSWWRSVMHRLLQDTGLGSRLVIEVTETAHPPSWADAKDLLLRFRAAGCRIALDDFGAGLSSIAFARMLRPDIIKIDGVYVRETVELVFGPELLSGLVAMSSCLATCVVVEGIEDAVYLSAAQAAGAGWVQGYHLGRPEIPTAPPFARDKDRLSALILPNAPSSGADHYALGRE